MRQGMWRNARALLSRVELHGAQVAIWAREGAAPKVPQADQRTQRPMGTSRVDWVLRERRIAGPALHRRTPKRGKGPEGRRGLVAQPPQRRVASVAFVGKDEWIVVHRKSHSLAARFF
jgi:hypothetical protein